MARGWPCNREIKKKGLDHVVISGNTQLNFVYNKRITPGIYSLKIPFNILGGTVALPPPPSSLSSPSQLLETVELKFCCKRKSTSYTFTFICINDTSDGDPSYDWSSTPLVVVKDDRIEEWKETKAPCHSLFWHGTYPSIPKGP